VKFIILGKHDCLIEQIQACGRKALRLTKIKCTLRENWNGCMFFILNLNCNLH